MGLENVVHTKNFDSNDNPSRTIVGLLPSPAENHLKLEQVRIALIKEEVDIGNHWREYREKYGIIGKGEFKLRDIDTGEQRNYNMETGDLLEIPSRVALRVSARSGSVIVCLSESYDREAGTHKYTDFK